MEGGDGGVVGGREQAWRHTVQYEQLLAYEHTLTGYYCVEAVCWRISHVPAVVCPLSDLCHLTQLQAPSGMPRHIRRASIDINTATAYLAAYTTGCRPPVHGSASRKNATSLRSALYRLQGEAKQHL